MQQAGKDSFFRKPIFHRAGGALKYVLSLLLKSN
jgi:hypothetical protein